MSDDYRQFLESKRLVAQTEGIHIPADALTDALFPFQKQIVSWALRKGRAAVYADTGLGKTRMQVVWASHIPGNVLILAPLAVAHQTVREAERIGIAVRYCRRQADVQPGITITNYEMLSAFDPAYFAGVVLDESSILKSFNGATKQAIIEAFGRTPYRLACTATPAPNDHMELGNHAEFLGIMSRTEMLSMFFVHDGGNTSKWRLKGHAEEAFWRWVASWGMTVGKPSDMGYPDDGYNLPPLTLHKHILEIENVESSTLFPTEALTLTEQRQSKRASLSHRVVKVAALVAAEPAKSWLIWCELNDEGDALAAAIPGAVQVAGSDSPDFKERAMLDFADGAIRVLVSKSSICGFGMNWQHCARVAFVGCSHSFEQTYQAIRRCWRFGQTRPVECHIVYAEAEAAIVRNLERKEREAEKMKDAMVRQMQCAHAEEAETFACETGQAVCTDRYRLYHADCVDALREMEDNSIDYSIFSPPFASLYTYSNSERDMGNSNDWEEFFTHYRFMICELFRVIKPGRLISAHCQNFPAMKERDGYIGIKDFRGELIRVHQEAGFIYHSEVCIWKDPVQAMQRTKAIGLLHKQLEKDSALSRQGIPDYLVTMRKPGVNEKPISGYLAEYSGEDEISFAGKYADEDAFGSRGMTPERRKSIEIWQRYASPVWMDIKASDTLQRESAREEKDERHICLLQLQVIERALQLWTNPNDVVLSPFAGIGSEGYVAIKAGRRFVGVELKRSYFEQAARNLRNAEVEAAQLSMFDDAEEAVAVPEGNEALV